MIPPSEFPRRRAGPGSAATREGIAIETRELVREGVTRA